MRALITGSTGFVGKNLINHLLEKGDEVFGTYIAPEIGSVAGCQYFECNIADAEQVRNVVNQVCPEVVYHLAAIAFVPLAEKDFLKTLTINVAGTNNIVKACHELGREITVLLVSSADVYGVATSLPITESSTPLPRNNYSLSKLMAEQVLARYERVGLLKGIIVRPFNHIGPAQSDLFVVSSFAKQLALIAEGKQSAVMQVGLLTAKRDFCDVRDVVRAYRLAVENVGHGHKLYNLCSGQSVTIQTILDKLIAISGVNVKIEQDPARMRASDIPDIYGSYAKAENELGWRPMIQLEQSLKDIYQYWLAQV